MFLDPKKPPSSPSPYFQISPTHDELITTLNQKKSSQKMGQTHVIIRPSLRDSTYNYVNLRGMRLNYVLILDVS
jgi:hypothetical protein